MLIEVVPAGTKINFLLRQAGVEKRVFKFFTDKSGDLFVSFPYFRATSYHAGVGHLAPGSTTRQLNPVIEGNESPIPLKLSYHRDGQVHFKPLRPQALSLPPHFKNAEVKATPLDRLRTQHIMTVEVEGLERYEDFVPTKPSEWYRGFEAPPDAKRFKFVFYAGLSQGDMSGRFKACSFFDIERPGGHGPLTVGLYFRPFPEAMDGEHEPSHLICLAGFRREHMDPNHEARFVYLFGK
jgi:hypothetical protein